MDRTAKVLAACAITLACLMLVLALLVSSEQPKQQSWISAPHDKELLTRWQIYELATQGQTTAIIYGREVVFDDFEATKKFLWHE